jgi:hypothetical protein
MAQDAAMTPEELAQAKFLLGPWVCNITIINAVQVTDHLLQLVGTLVELFMQGILTSQVGQTFDEFVNS